MQSAGSNTLSHLSGRCRPLEATLGRAKGWAAAAGISRVYEITHLDCLDVPVFVSVRPRAMADVFTFGKGLDSSQAEVSAYMEAIEFHFAEPGSSGIETSWGKVRDVAGCRHDPEAILSFAPLLNAEADLGLPLLLASVQDCRNGAEWRVPAELIFYPAPQAGQTIFGASTNGLASGNSIEEATLHALSELIERDIWSFETVRRTSVLVDPNTLPDEIREVVRRAERSGLKLKIRTIANDYDLPFFAAFLFDPDDIRRKFFNGGWGCGLDRSAALAQAVAEAAQSRLAFIHGGRPEPTRSDGSEAANPDDEEMRLIRAHMSGVSDPRSQMSFWSLPDHSSDGSPARRFELLSERLQRVCPGPMFRAVFTSPDADLQVVRLVVPGLESFKETRVRVGPRLKTAIDAGASAARAAS